MRRLNNNLHIKKFDTNYVIEGDKKQFEAQSACSHLWVWQCTFSTMQFGVWQFARFLVTVKAVQLFNEFVVVSRFTKIIKICHRIDNSLPKIDPHNKTSCAAIASAYRWPRIFICSAEILRCNANRNCWGFK